MFIVVVSWEALAMLVAMRLWRSKTHRAARAKITSDSLGALLALARGNPPSPGLTLILQEVALEEAESRKNGARKTIFLDGSGY